MNKSEFIEKLTELTGFKKEKCEKINEILENHFIIGKNNKDKIIDDLMSKLSLTKEECDDIYNKAMSLIATGLKDKIINPFKSKD